MVSLYRVNFMYYMHHISSVGGGGGGGGEEESGDRIGRYSQPYFHNIIN